MSYTYRILLTILSIASICKAVPGVHTYMSPHQLQSVFHVDSAADVPHYEVVQLLHHNSEPGTALSGIAHYRNRRSINSASGVQIKETHHVKKDLSKNPYYSELKAATAAGGGEAVNSVYAYPENPSRNILNDLNQISEHNVSFSAFGKYHNLTLRATQGLFKGAPHTLRMWMVNNETNATHGLNLEEMLDGHNNSAEIGHVFQDEDNMAAILMRRQPETGDLIMEGSIGHEIVIKPLPHDLSPSKDQTHHIIYKRAPAQMDHLSDFAFMEPDDLATNEKLEKLQQQRRRRRSASLADLTADDAELSDDELEEEDEFTASESRNRPRRQAPYMIYPEILVIVDYDGYRLHGGDNLQVKRYFISFWNGVDLRYRLLKGPRIRISIAGIIISRGRDATPYLERNRVGRDAIDSAAALTDMGKYLFRERRLPVYDIAVAITKYDMCRRRKGGRCTKGTAGFAYVGGACVVNKRLEKVNSVAIIEDTGGFSGIIVAAHEVGHLLGAVHDGSPPPSYLGGPGAQRCRWEDGYIMSDLRHTERGFRWSPCTVQSFHHFLNGDTATCLHNQPHEDGALGRSLPGTLLSLDAQCRRDRGTYACFKDERVCAQLFCFDAQTGYCVAYRPAAEGSSCGNGLHCLDGRCTPSPTNNIGYGPQYSLVYNNADATNSAENTEDSSEEEDVDEEDEEDVETEVNENENDEEKVTKSNEEDHEDENALQNLQKTDNSVEETSLEITDENNKTNDSQKIITTTTKSPRLLTKTLPNTYTTPTQIQAQLNAIEFLKNLLQNKAQWQHLLKATPVPPPIITLHSPIFNTPIPHTQNAKNNGDNPIIVKTSTSSSVSFSSSSESYRKRNEEKQIRNSSSNEIGDSQQQFKEDYQQNPHRRQQHEAHHSKHQQQTPTQHIFKNFSTEFRKQFQYYLKLLNRNNGKSNNDNHSSSSRLSSSYSYKSNNDSSCASSSSAIGILKTPKIKNATTTTKSTNSLVSPTNSPNSNYSATHNSKKNNNSYKNIRDNDDNIDDENEEDANNNSNDDNVESNEAIDKQKRKFDVKFTTKLKQEQLQFEQKSISTTIASVQPTARNTIFGGRSPTTARSNSFLDAYFRKFQALNAPAQHSTAQSAAQVSLKLLSTATTSSTSSSKGSASTPSSLENNKKQHQTQFDKFAGQFLKLVNWKAFSF